MNRLVIRISAVCLGAAIAFSSPNAFAKKPKKKKNVDLTANPLANVNSKQPDKELYDKAMFAMKNGRYDVARLDLFGRKAGLAFQIADDVLDMTEDSSALGKTAGKDQATEKVTWPAVFGIDRPARTSASSAICRSCR